MEGHSGLVINHNGDQSSIITLTTIIMFRHISTVWTVSLVYWLLVVDCGFDPWWGQTKDYNIGIYCFSAKHAALRRKSKDWLARNLDNVSE